MNGKDNNLRIPCITNIILLVKCGRLASDSVIVWGSKTDICHYLWLWLLFTAETGGSHGSKHTDSKQQPHADLSVLSISLFLIHEVFSLITESAEQSTSLYNLVSDSTGYHAISDYVGLTCCHHVYR